MKKDSGGDPNRSCRLHRSYSIVNYLQELDMSYGRSEILIKEVIMEISGIYTVL